MMWIKLDWKAYYETIWQFAITFFALTIAWIYLTILILKSFRRFWCHGNNSHNDDQGIGQSIKLLTVTYLVLFWLYAIMSWIFRVLIIMFDIPIICLMSDLVIVWFGVSRMALHLVYLIRYVEFYSC